MWNKVIIFLIIIIISHQSNNIFKIHSLITYTYQLFEVMGHTTQLTPFFHPTIIRHSLCARQYYSTELCSEDSSSPYVYASNMSMEPLAWLMYLRNNIVNFTQFWLNLNLHNHMWFMYWTEQFQGKFLAPGSYQASVLTV